MLDKFIYSNIFLSKIKSKIKFKKDLVTNIDAPNFLKKI